MGPLSHTDLHQCPVVLAALIFLKCCMHSHIHAPQHLAVDSDVLLHNDNLDCVHYI